MAFIDDEVRRFFAEPPVYYREAGDDEVAGGPINVSGWYCDPYCHPMCCRPDGPFATAAEAREWAWHEYQVPEKMRVHTPLAAKEIDLKQDRTSPAG